MDNVQCVMIEMKITHYPLPISHYFRGDMKNEILELVSARRRT